jgi:hypothetical protein
MLSLRVEDVDAGLLDVPPSYRVGLCRTIEYTWRTAMPYVRVNQGTNATIIIDPFGRTSNQAKPVLYHRLQSALAGSFCTRILPFASLFADDRVATTGITASEALTGRCC